MKRRLRLLVLAVRNKWRALRGQPERPELLIFERNLREVFWKDDAVFVSRALRLFVLYEDLRIEYLGAMVSVPIVAIEDIGKNFRRNYFIRRSLVTLIEFSSAISRLNEVKEWKKHVGQTNDGLAQRWNAATNYFSENASNWKKLRGDVGGHFLEQTAEFALRNLSVYATGEVHLRQFHGRQQGGILFPFTNELVAIGMRKTMKVENNKEPTEDEIRQFFHDLFGVVTEGWEHAVNAVNIVAHEYLMPRFIREEDRV